MRVAEFYILKNIGLTMNVRMERSSDMSFDCISDTRVNPYLIILLEYKQQNVSHYIV